MPPAREEVFLSIEGKHGKLARAKMVTEVAAYGLGTSVSAAVPTSA